MPARNGSPILCGACKRQVEVPADAKPDYKVVCSGCRRSDRLDSVVRSAQEHLMHHAQKQLSESLVRATRSNSFIKFETQRPQHRTFRWVTA